MLEGLGIDLTPAALIASKEIVRDKEKPKFVKRKLPFQPSQSWMTYMVKRTLQDFQQTVLQVCFFCIALEIYLCYLVITIKVHKLCLKNIFGIK